MGFPGQEPPIATLSSMKKPWSKVERHVLEPIMPTVMVKYGLSSTGRRQPIGQRGGLVVRARLPQAVQQAGHAVRVVEGGVGGRIINNPRVP